MRKLAVVLTAAAVALGSVGMSSAQSADIAKSVAANRSNFQDKMQLTTRLLSLVKSHPGDSATLKTEDYAFTFYSDDIGSLEHAPKQYDLRTTRLTEDLDAFDVAVGFKTPKYVIEVAEDEEFPCPIYLTLRESNFMPGSLLYVYEHTDTDRNEEGVPLFTFEPVAENIRVEENGDATFPITSGGTFLISPKPIADHSDVLEAAVYDYDMPERNDIDELLSYLQEDPDGYFANIWEAPSDDQ